MQQTTTPALKQLGLSLAESLNPMQHVLAGPLDAHQLDKYTGRRCYLSPTSLRRGEMIELLPGVSGSPLSVFRCKSVLYECPPEAIAAALPAQSRVLGEEKLVQAR